MSQFPCDKTQHRKLLFPTDNGTTNESVIHGLRFLRVRPLSRSRAEGWFIGAYACTWYHRQWQCRIVRQIYGGGERRLR